MERAKQKPYVVPKFEAPQFPPSVGPTRKGVEMAMDDAVSNQMTWLNAALVQRSSEGQQFIGYPELATLSQRPEYRRISEIIAMEMTRRWVEVVATGQDDKTDKIQAIERVLKEFDVQDAFREMALQDGLFGRSHLFLDFGQTVGPELETNIGNGRNETSKYKVARNSFRGVKVVEAIWTYPQDYNTTNPLAEDFYKPQFWMVFGQRVHVSRLLRFVSREVPDILKPVYAFGGVSMSQLVRPYVDNWLRTRQSVSDLIHSFAVSGVKTNLGDLMMQGDGEVYKRVDFYNQMRDNRGTMLLDMETEDFFTVSTPLGTLDHLQAQAQEHMASVSGIPIVKLLGIQPAGLNASSEGELECFYTWVESQQESLFREPLKRVISFIQMSLWGEVDPEIDFKFRPLRVLDDKTAAEVREIDARTGKTLVESGAITKAEERERVASDPETPYDGLDLDVIPDLNAEQKARVAEVGIKAIVEGQSAGLLSDRQAMQELQQLSRTTDFFRSVTQADIDLAEVMPQNIHEIEAQNAGMGAPIEGDFPKGPGPAGGGGGAKPNVPFQGGHDAGFRPDEPRDRRGRWTALGRAETGKAITADLYHGTPDGRFLARGEGFREKSLTGSLGVSFSEDYGTAKSYADDRRAFDYQNAEPTVVRRRVTMQNPLVVDMKGDKWNLGSYEQFVKDAKAKGHDGIVFKNIRDHYQPDSAKKPSNTVLVFNVDGIKEIEQAQDAFNPEDHPRLPAGAAPSGNSTKPGEFVKKDADVTLQHEAIDVGGDKWNKETAIRLESEYARVKPELEKLLNKVAVNPDEYRQIGDDAHDIEAGTLVSLSPDGAVGTLYKVIEVDLEKGVVIENVTTHEKMELSFEGFKKAYIKENIVASEDDEDDEDITPVEWAMLSDEQQEETFSKWKESTWDSFHSDEVQNWYDNGSAKDDALNQIAYNFNKQDETDWAIDALNDGIEERLPLPAQDIVDAMDLSYDGGWDGDVDHVDITFNDDVLANKFMALQEQIETLPGVEPPNYAAMLTEDMRTKIVDAVREALDKHAESVASDMDPPEYLSDGVGETQDMIWDGMSDDEKFKNAQEYGVIEEIKKDSDEPDTITIPTKFDPLNETTGRDYQMTQFIARRMSIRRAKKAISERLGKDVSISDLSALDETLWRGWKGSSADWDGQVIQLAVAEELGGRMRSIAGRNASIDRDQLVKEVDRRWPEIGGYDGVKAYMRAKWETTQFLLDKANVHELKLYRALDQSVVAKPDAKYYDTPDIYKGVGYEDKKNKVVPQKTDRNRADTYYRMPNFVVQRNGAASTTTDPKVANDWDGDNRVVLRAIVPRTAVVSVPAYGINVQSEHEVVVAGTAWKAWDAWYQRAPRFEDSQLYRSEKEAEADVVRIDKEKAEAAERVKQFTSGMKVGDKYLGKNGTIYTIKAIHDDGMVDATFPGVSAPLSYTAESFQNFTKMEAGPAPKVGDKFEWHWTGATSPTYYEVKSIDSDGKLNVELSFPGYKNMTSLSPDDFAAGMAQGMTKVDTIPATAATQTESTTGIGKYPTVATSDKVKVGVILYSGMNQDYKYKVTSLPDAEGWIGLEAISKNGKGPQGSKSSTKLSDGHMFFSESDAKKYHDNKEYL